MSLPEEPTPVIASPEARGVQSPGLQSPSVQSPSVQALKAAVVGIILVGCGVGVGARLFSGSSVSNDRPLPAGRALAAAAAEDRVLLQVTPASNSPAAAPRPVVGPAASLRIVVPQIEVPEDPFLPTEPDPVATGVPAAASGLSGTAPGTGGAATGPAPSPDGSTPGGAATVLTAPPAPGAAGAPALPGARVARPSGPAAKRAVPPVTVETPTVTGIVQGDPPLIVARHGDQTHFLRVGDQLAGVWKLLEINDRSAVFQRGGQRIELPIQGGSAQ